jgi:hypothetical protein
MPQSRAVYGARLLQPFMPQSVNNNATVSNTSKQFRMVGTEYASQPVTLNPTSPAGTIIFNTLLLANLCPRLNIISQAWQRWKINKLSFKIVTLNGSTVQSGYTLAFIDDPSYPIGTNPSDIVNLTAFKGSCVRQNWVESSVLRVTKNGDNPPLFVNSSTGSDPRLFSPGRVVCMLNGPPAVGEGNAATWALMLEYDVSFFVPGVTPLGVGPTPPISVSFVNERTILSSTVGGDFNGLGVTGTPVPAAGSPPLLPNTRYYLAVPLETPFPEGDGVDSYIIGFRTPADNSNSNLYRFLFNPTPENAATDALNEVVNSTGQNVSLFFSGTGFFVDRPLYRPAG